MLLLRVDLVNAQPSQFITFISESSNERRPFVYYQDQFQDNITPFFRLDTVAGRWQPLQIATKVPLCFRLSNDMEQATIYAQPGDTIYVQTHLNKWPYYTFRGSKSSKVRLAELNFFTELNTRHIGIGLPDAAGLFFNARYPFQMAGLCEKFDRRMALLKRYNDSLHLAPAFVTFACHRIRAQYLTALFSPYYGKERVFDQFPASYMQTLDAIGVEHFLTNDTLLFTTQDYRVLAYDYVRYLSRAAHGTPQELETMYQQASSALRGRTRDYALFYLLKQNLGKHLPSFNSYLERFRRDCATPDYVQYIDSVSNRPRILQLEPDLLNTPLLSTTGETSTWAQMLARNRGKVLYLDLWASWCGPCLAEMPASAKLQTKLTGKEVQFVYFSVDRDKGKWLKSLEKEQLAQPGTQHYLLAPDSKLAKFLNAPPIPRYVLIDKQGQAASLDAARPSNPPLLADIDNLLK
ncbi:hypothetical protein BXP70_09460 [Hymenobacter crusticola]|uniref:Thioredoxin domain-containing protein n=1 Tax=Hymenobacter crusticola TaxID=1770526 RepID=A0A243WE53_9BACT|nr:hypothetical protein BXP70_09460 [Hymenobacter crusticola]